MKVLLIVARAFILRVNEVIVGLQLPQNIDALLMKMRNQIVDAAVYKKVIRGRAIEVHTFNRFFRVAYDLGFGVYPIIQEDVYLGEVDSSAIEQVLIDAFLASYHPITGL